MLLQDLQKANIEAMNVAYFNSSSVEIGISIKRVNNIYQAKVSYILTNDNSGVLKAGTAMDVTKEYTKTTAIGAASGAVLGVVMGALSGGSVGKGAIYGTAVGGGMGLIRPIFERGGNVELPQNAQFDIILDQPLTVSTNSLYQ